MMRPQIVWYASPQTVAYRKKFKHLVSDFDITWCPFESASLPVIARSHDSINILELDEEWSTTFRIQEWWSSCDGIITSNRALADAISLKVLVPVRACAVASPISNFEQIHFADEVAGLIKSIRLASISQSVMSKVSEELRYLQVDDTSPLVDSVSQLLSTLW